MNIMISCLRLGKDNNKVHYIKRSLIIEDKRKLIVTSLQEMLLMKYVNTHISIHARHQCARTSLQPHRASC